MFARTIPLTLFISSLAIGGCAGDTESEAPGSNEANVAASAPIGRFELASAPDVQLKAGDLFQLEVSKRSNKYEFTVQIVSTQCGFGRPDATCPASWVLGDDRSLDQYDGTAVFDTSAKTMKITYELTDRDGTEVARSFRYAKRSGELELTEGTTSIKLAELPALAPPDPATMEALDQFISGGGEVSESTKPAPPLTQIPMAVRREAHFYDQRWGDDYPAGIAIFPLDGVEYYTVEENNDGGGAIVFFTKEGQYINSFGGSESSEWSWSRDWQH